MFTFEVATKCCDKVDTLSLGRNGGWTAVASLACIKFLERSAFDRSALAATSPSPTTKHTKVCVGTCTQTCKRFHVGPTKPRGSSTCGGGVVSLCYRDEEDMACTVCIYDVLNLVVACVPPRFKCTVKLESNFGRVRWLYSTCGTKFSLSSCKCDLNLDELQAPTPKFSLGSTKCDF